MLRTGDYDGAAYRTPPAQPAPAGFSSVAGPVLHLPAAPQDNQNYLLWSTERFTPMVNGWSGVTPPRFLRIVELAAPFPDRSSVAALRAFGVRSVALHLSPASMQPPGRAGAEDRPRGSASAGRFSATSWCMTCAHPGNRVPPFTMHPASTT